MDEKVDLETTKISTQPKCNLTRRRQNTRGFTLIEVMIVLAIFGAVIAIGVPRLTRTDSNIRSVARQLTVLIKETRNHARMKNRTFRIVFEVGKVKGNYWVESTSKSIRLKDPRLTEAEDDKKEDDEEDKDAKPVGLFEEDKSFLKEKKELPGKLKFISVETQGLEEPITEGKAYLHFFPEGLVESAAIQMGDGAKLTWTLVPNPMTGKTDIVQKELTLKDIENR